MNTQKATAGSHCHILHIDGTCAFVRIPVTASRHSIYRIRQAFSSVAFPENKAQAGKVDDWRLDTDNSFRGVYWSEESSSANGSGFVILPCPGITPEEITECVSHLKKTTDVVGVRVIKWLRWIEFDAAPYLEAHTEGCWCAVAVGCGDEAEHWQVSDEYEPLARVFGQASLPEVAANARLMAAAPDLLEALRHMLHADSLISRTPHQHAIQHHSQLARAAIRKATQPV